MAFDAPLAKTPKVRRREFLTWSAGGAFMLAVARPAVGQPPARGAAAGTQSPWFKVTKEGRVVVLSNAVEMGQGSHTGHASIIAHELDVPWDMVDVEMVDIQEFANQVFTGGSRSISGTFDVARKAGATARTQFMEAAAKQWNVPVDQVETSGGKVVHAWLVEADLDLTALRSNVFEIEWPPRSGRRATFPEVDQAAYFDAATAVRKIHKGQHPILAQAIERLPPG